MGCKASSLESHQGRKKSSQWFSRSSFVPVGTRSPSPSGPSVETALKRWAIFTCPSGTKQRPFIADKCDNGPGIHGYDESVRVLSVPPLGGVRGGFMVPMHAKKRMGALHEPSHARPLRGLNVAYIFVAGRCGREISFKASLVWTTSMEHATVQRWYPSARQGDRK